MASTTRKWLAGCGVGCGGLVLVLIVIGVIGSSLLMNQFDEAIATREELEQRFGEQADYTPPPDGAVGPERLEAFLAVREAAMTACASFTRTAADFRGMDDRARNGALAAAGMGLGEYTYLYVVAYGDSLRSLPPDAALFGQEGVGLRAREVLRTMLRNQLAALATAGSDAEPADGWRREQQAEIDRLEAEPDRLPWQDGLPPALAASLAPYRGRLGAAFCAATAGLELTRSRKRGLSITSD
jgi:hypothetical protein